MGQKSSSLALKKTFKYLEYSQYFCKTSGNFFLLKDYFIRQTLKQFFKQNKFMLNNLLILQSENKVQLFLNIFTKKDLYKKLRFSRIKRKRYKEKFRLRTFQTRTSKKHLLYKVGRLLSQTTKNRIYKASWKQIDLEGVTRVNNLKENYNELINLNLFKTPSLKRFLKIKQNKFLKKKLTKQLFLFFLKVLYKKYTNKLFFFYFFHKINIFLNNFKCKTLFKSLYNQQKNNFFSIFQHCKINLLSSSNRFSQLTYNTQLKVLKSDNLSYTLFNKFFLYKKKTKKNFYNLRNLYINLYKKINNIAYTRNKLPYQYKRKNIFQHSLTSMEEREQHLLLSVAHILRQKRFKAKRKQRFLRFLQRKKRHAVQLKVKTRWKKKVYFSYKTNSVFKQVTSKFSERRFKYLTSLEKPYIFKKKKKKVLRKPINQSSFIKQYNFFFKYYLINTYKNNIFNVSSLHIKQYYQLYQTQFKKKYNLKFRFLTNNKIKYKKIKHRKIISMSKYYPILFENTYRNRNKFFTGSKNKKKKFFFIFFYFGFTSPVYSKTKLFISTFKSLFKGKKTTQVVNYKINKILKNKNLLKKTTYSFKRNNFKKRYIKINKRARLIKNYLKKFLLAKQLIKTLKQFSWFRKLRIKRNLQPLQKKVIKFKLNSHNLIDKNFFYKQLETQLQLVQGLKKKFPIKLFLYKTINLNLSFSNKIKYFSKNILLKKNKVSIDSSLIKLTASKYLYLRILLQKYKSFLKKKKYLLSLLLRKLLKKFILSKTVAYATEALSSPYEQTSLTFYKRRYLKRYYRYAFKYNRGLRSYRAQAAFNKKKGLRVEPFNFFKFISEHPGEPSFYKINYHCPLVPYKYIKSMYGTHGKQKLKFYKKRLIRVTQNAIYRFRYRAFSRRYKYNPLSTKRQYLPKKSFYFVHKPLIFLQPKKRKRIYRRLKSFISIQFNKATTIMKNSVQTSRRLLEKLTNNHLLFFYRQRLQKKINLKKTNTIFLQKLALVLKKYFKINNIQICLHYKLYNFLKQYKQKKLILYNLNKMFFKKYVSINQVKFTSDYIPQTSLSFINFKNLNYKKFNDFTYFRILKQKFFTRKFFKNNELIVILLNCLFYRTSTVYLASYICTIFKKLKYHNLLLKHLDRLLKYFFNDFMYNLPITGLKIIIKGRINGTPRKKTGIFSYGVTQSQTLNVSFDYNQTTAFTRYGTFGIRIWRYF